MLGYSSIVLVAAARPAISVKESRHSFQYPVSPPKPRNFIIDSTKSIPASSAARVMARLCSKVGEYCGLAEDRM
jgi:hypothetical protein